MIAPKVPPPASPPVSAYLEDAPSARCEVRWLDPPDFSHGQRKCAGSAQCIMHLNPHVSDNAKIKNLVTFLQHREIRSLVRSMEDSLCVLFQGARRGSEKLDVCLVCSTCFEGAKHFLFFLLDLYRGSRKLDVFSLLFEIPRSGKLEVFLFLDVLRGPENMICSCCWTCSSGRIP